MFSFFCFSLSRTLTIAATLVVLLLSSEASLVAQPDAQASIPGQLLSIEISQRGEVTDLVLHLEGGQLSAGARQGRDGKISIQLGNYVPGPDIQDLEVAEGLISKIEVRPKYRRKRPITVVRVTTRQPAKFSLDPGDGQVRVQLQQAEDSARKLDPKPAQPPGQKLAQVQPPAPAQPRPRTVQSPAPQRPRPDQAKPPALNSAPEPPRQVAAPAPSRPRPRSTSAPTAEVQPTAKRTAPVRPALPEASELIGVAQGWAQAWSSRDVEGYLAFYSRDFQPDKGLSREQWQARRRQRLVAPTFVEVATSDFKTSILDVNRATIRFIQDYRSDTLHDRGYKTLDLVHQEGSWKILRETWGSLVP